MATPPLYAQRSAAEALNKAKVLKRLAEGSPASKSAGAPSFVVDPAWPKRLPNNWIIGDVGGITVDKRDHIWVYHRPRSLSSTDSGAQGVAGKDDAGNPVSALGFRRPYGPLSGCCVPAPSVLEFDKDGNLIQAWGGPSDPGFLEKRCRVEDGCTWPAREHGIFVDHNDFVYVSGHGLGPQEADTQGGDERTHLPADGSLRRPLPTATRWPTAHSALRYWSRTDRRARRASRAR